MKGLLQKNNFRSLDSKMWKAMQLFNIHADTETNTIPVEILWLELQAGGIAEKHEVQVNVVDSKNCLINHANDYSNILVDKSDFEKLEPCVFFRQLLQSKCMQSKEKLIYSIFFACTSSTRNTGQVSNTSNRCLE